MANTTTQTILSLDRYAEIMGINPVAFNQGSMYPRCYTTCKECDQVWYQYAFQNPSTFSREELALLISQVEREVSRFLGAPLVPTYTSQYFPFKVHSAAGFSTKRLERDYVPVHLGRYFSSLNGPLAYTKVKTVSLGDDMEILDSSDATYDSANGNCPDHIQITVPLADLPDGVEYTDLRVSYADRYNSPKWEIAVFDREISGDNALLKVKPWLAGKRSLIELYQVADDGSCDVPELNMLSRDSYAESLDIFYQYHDIEEPIATFHHKEPSQFPTSETTDGYAVVDPSRKNFALAYPAQWDDTLSSWVQNTACGSTDFSGVTVRYWHGYNGDITPFERAIAHIVTARIPENVCGCSCDREEWWRMWQQDMLMRTPDGAAYIPTVAVQESVFGQRRGEVDGYLIIVNETKESMVSYA